MNKPVRKDRISQITGSYHKEENTSVFSSFGCMKFCTKGLHLIESEVETGIIIIEGKSAFHSRDLRKKEI